MAGVTDAELQMLEEAVRAEEVVIPGGGAGQAEEVRPASDAAAEAGAAPPLPGEPDSRLEDGAMPHESSAELSEVIAVGRMRQKYATHTGSLQQLRLVAVEDASRLVVHCGDG